jgi:hypothetical protein
VDNTLEVLPRLTSFATRITSKLDAPSELACSLGTDTQGLVKIKIKVDNLLDRAMPSFGRTGTPASHSCCEAWTFFWLDGDLGNSTLELKRNASLLG